MQYVLSFLLGLLFISYFTLSHILSPYPTSNIHYPLSHIQSTAHIFIPHSMYFISHLIPPHRMFLTHILHLISHIPSFNSIPRTSHSLSHISYHTSSPSLAHNSQNPQLPVNEWNQFPSELTLQISFRTHKKSLLTINETRYPTK